MAILDLTDLTDVVQGAALLGSGGGGPIHGGEIMIEAIRTRGGGRVTLLSAPWAEIADDALGAVVADVGEADQVVPNQADATWNAFVRLRDLLRVTRRQEIAFVSPGEIGPENSLAPAWVAAHAGLPLIDGDGSRRAVPVLEMASFSIVGLPPCPAAIAGPDSSALILHADDANGLEALMRPALGAPAFAESAGMALWPMSGRQLKEAAIPGGISLALDIGRVLRNAHAKGVDPLRALKTVKGLEPELLCSGRLGHTTSSQSNGFDIGATPVTGAGGEQVTLLSKNEILVAWNERHAEPIATAPDSVSLVTAAAQAFTLAEADQYEGQQVLVVRIPAVPFMRQEAALAVTREQLRQLGYLGPPMGQGGAAGS